MDARLPKPVSFVPGLASLIAGLAAAAALLLLSACGTASSVGGDSNGASTGLASFTRSSGDALDRPTRVAWTSARASRCGFVFDPARLRASYLAYEQSYGHSPKQMRKIQEAYDYALESVATTANKDPNYCTRQRVDETRADLNRYLAGDFRAP